MAKLNTHRLINGQVFILSEKLDDYRTASLAQAEYWASGVCCRKVPVQPTRGKGFYELWIGPERIRQVRLLDGEVITREKGSRLWRVG